MLSEENRTNRAASNRREALHLGLLLAGGAAVVPSATRADTADPFYGGLQPEDDLALTGPLPQDPKAVETFSSGGAGSGAANPSRQAAYLMLQP